MKRNIFVIIFTLFLLIPSLAYSSHETSQTVAYQPISAPSDILSYYKSVQELPRLSISIPTVVQMSLDNTSQDYLIYEVESQTMQKGTILSTTLKTPVTITSTTNNRKTPLTEPNLIDNNEQTFTTYEVTDEINENTAQFTFSYSQFIQTSQLMFTLGENVQNPVQISIQAKKNGDSQETIIVNKRYISGNVISFPQTYANTFIVTFYYNQPLRITESAFVEDNNYQQNSSLRFLTRPNFSYKIYSNPVANKPYYQAAETGNVTGNSVSVLSIASPVVQENILFQVPDSDNDQVADDIDNCPNTTNSDQTDVNKNKRGDACEDFDTDGIMNDVDNCPDHPNKYQQDNDNDKLGDHCDDEESRIIERLSFLPWVGLGLGFAIVILLFKFTVTKHANDTKSPETTTENSK